MKTLISGVFTPHAFVPLCHTCLRPKLAIHTCFRPLPITITVSQQLQLTKSTTLRKNNYIQSTATLHLTSFISWAKRRACSAFLRTPCASEPSLFCRVCVSCFDRTILIRNRNSINEQQKENIEIRKENGTIDGWTDVPYNSNWSKQTNKKVKHKINDHSKQKNKSNKETNKTKKLLLGDSCSYCRLTWGRIQVRTYPVNFGPLSGVVWNAM